MLDGFSNSLSWDNIRNRFSFTVYVQMDYNRKGKWSLTGSNLLLNTPNVVRNILSSEGPMGRGQGI